ncbi:MAG TPA: division initiation protein, partial [Clostridium sp.]|nr:division initiation protein [Clostridium sp.]
MDDLNAKAKEFEEAAAGRTEESTVLLEELQQTRLQTGAVDVKGEGIIIYITPKKNLFANDIKFRPMYDEQLLGIVNELNAADAE